MHVVRCLIIIHSCYIILLSILQNVSFFLNRCLIRLVDLLSEGGLYPIPISVPGSWPFLTSLFGSCIFTKKLSGCRSDVICWLLFLFLFLSSCLYHDHLRLKPTDLGTIISSLLGMISFSDPKREMFWIDRDASHADHFRTFSTRL